jgi:hypothetical protein
MQTATTINMALDLLFWMVDPAGEVVAPVGTLELRGNSL